MRLADNDQFCIPLWRLPASLWMFCRKKAGIGQRWSNSITSPGLQCPQSALPCLNSEPFWFQASWWIPRSMQRWLMAACSRRGGNSPARMPLRWPAKETFGANI